MFSKLLQWRTANNLPSALISHLLTSNDPPSDAEEALVRDAIQALRCELTALKCNLSSPPWNLTTLERRESAIIKRIAAHESIISPLRRLPPELLRLVFQNTYWDNTTTFMLPWSLSQVCRLWRTIVHDTPFLWSHVTIDFDAKPRRLRSQEARLKVVLRRSASVDLDVSIRGTINGGHQHLALLSTLLAQCERWGSFNLTITTGTIKALQTVKGRLPRLSRLYLKFQKAHLDSIIDIFSIAPQLDAVTIDYRHLCPTPIIVPLHQLTTFVRYPGHSNPLMRPQRILRESLADFSNLVRLEIFRECPAGTVDPPEHRITFPRLEILVVAFNYDNEETPTTFFRRLILPSIREISVEGGTGNGTVMALSSMISQSLPCALHSLSIDDVCSAPSGELTSLLHLIPQLKSLEIVLPPPYDLSSLFPTPESPVLVPYLESLHFLIWGSQASEVLVMRKMLENAGVEFRMKSLELRFRSERDCRDWYFALQLPPPVGDLDDEVLALINSWKAKLLDGIEFPGRRYDSRKHQKQLNSAKIWRQLNCLFNEIEGYNIPTSGYLHASKLPRNCTS